MNIAAAVDAYYERVQRDRDDWAQVRETEYAQAFDAAHDEIMSCDAQRLAEMVNEAAEYKLADAVLAAVRDFDRENPNALKQLPAIWSAWASLHDAICNDAARGLR